ncbi:helix-turn-helix domain protein (plasmid) [Agrobacterium sp. RAC06]|nr:helix-turn-helix domain protein [Agrobacterium sp. RAC06]
MLLHRSGVPVLVPDPSCYAVHKLIVASHQHNDGQGSAKRRRIFVKLRCFLKPCSRLGDLLTWRSSTTKRGIDRLARKALIPARQISTAINRTTGKNFSQYVNEFRIAEACRLLAETKKLVTEVMLDVGFQTKSNFNREFRRVTDMTPAQRRAKRANHG